MAADSGSPGHGERRGNSARGARRGRGGVRAGPGGAARGGLRRRGAGRRCELWRSRKPPRGRDDSLNSPRPPPPPAAGSSRGSRGWRSRGRWTAPGRGGERARMPRGRLQGSLRRRIPPQGYAGPGEASRAARRPPGPCVCPAAGGPGAELPAGGTGWFPRRRWGGEASRSPLPQFGGAPGVAAAVGWSPRRGPEAVAASGAPPPGRRHRPLLAASMLFPLSSSRGRGYGPGPAPWRAPGAPRGAAAS